MNQNRLRISHPFGQRSVRPDSIDPKRLYFIAIAGEGQTEYQYIQSVKDNAISLGIKDSIIIEPLEPKEEDGKSHPKYILGLLKERKQNEDFDFDPDEMWMIIDRDKQNVKIEQLEEIISVCEAEGFNLALSNPTFELWLLLHLTSLDNYDKEELLRNKKINGKRLLERELTRLLEKSYKKPNIQFGQLKGGIKKAIERAKELPNDNKTLTHELGTSVSILIDKLFTL